MAEAEGPTGGQGDPEQASAHDDLDSGFVDIARSPASHPVSIGPYQIVGLLGGGSMATLYVANKVCPFGYVQRSVIKRVNHSRSDASMLQEMLLDEARAMAYFDHPNLVSLQDVGEDGHGAYIAMEFIDGTDLKRVNARLRSRREALPFELACFIVAEVLRGLHHAHTATDPDDTPLAIVHRDVNPSNVLISRTGHVKLTDFGVVRMNERVQQKTEPGLVKGKYAYLAPEYIAGGPCSVKTDLYAAGVMLFELLTGRECYTGRSAYEVMWKIVNKGVPLYRLDREGVPEDLRRIVERATAMDPEQRYRGAQDMANALEAWMVRNRRHATPWVLSVFFDRHHLMPGEHDRPAPMMPLANLQDAVQSDRSAVPSTAEPEGPSAEGDWTPPPPISVESPRASAPPSRRAPPPRADTGGRARGFTVSTTKPAPAESAAPDRLEESARPDDASLEMRDPHIGELTPMPAMEQLPPDDRIPNRAMDESGQQVILVPGGDERADEGVEDALAQTAETLEMTAKDEDGEAEQSGEPDPTVEPQPEREARELAQTQAPESPIDALDEPSTVEPGPLAGNGIEPNQGEVEPGAAEPPAEAPPAEPDLVPFEAQGDDLDSDAQPEAADPEAAEALKHALASAADLPPDEEEEARAPDPGDASPADRYAEASTVDLAQAKPEANTPRSGKLEDYPAADIIDAYCQQDRSGILEFRCGLIWKRVRLDRGRPTGITSNMGMELIGEHLVKARIISRDQLDQALEDSERSARSLTQTLLEQGALDRERLEVELGNNLSARLQEVLEWRWGTFEYTDKPVPSAEIEPRLDLPALLETARRKRLEDQEGGREKEISDNLNPHKRLKEALQVARSIANSSGKGRVDRPWRSDSRD
ncbi:MAG: serine/threonine protein kinase [Myxococcota bacterium]